MSENIREQMRQLAFHMRTAQMTDQSKLNGLRREQEAATQKIIQDLSDIQLAALYRGCLPGDPRFSMLFPGDEARSEIIRRFVKRNGGF